MRLEGLRRVDVPEIAVEALREAIINAFCHRDYYDPDYIQMAIFKDRVEIRNPGKLYGTLTIDDLRKGNISQRQPIDRRSYFAALKWWKPGAAVCP